MNTNSNGMLQFKLLPNGSPEAGNVEFQKRCVHLRLPDDGHSPETQ
jgi:hypothetical protein